MAMRKDQIPDNKFTLPLDARELALYTRQITKNAKVFDLEIDASLPFSRLYLPPDTGGQGHNDR